MNEAIQFSAWPVVGFHNVLKHQFGFGNRCFTADIESDLHSYVEKSNNLQSRGSLDLKKTDWLSHEDLIQISLPRRIEYVLQQNWTAFSLSTAFKYSSKLKPSLFYQNKHALTNYIASDSILSYFAQYRGTFFWFLKAVGLFHGFLYFCVWINFFSN